MIQRIRSRTPTVRQVLLQAFIAKSFPHFVFFYNSRKIKMINGQNIRLDTLPSELIQHIGSFLGKHIFPVQYTNGGMYHSLQRELKVQRTKVLRGRVECKIKERPRKLQNHLCALCHHPIVSRINLTQASIVIEFGTPFCQRHFQQIKGTCFYSNTHNDYITEVFEV